MGQAGNVITVFRRMVGESPFKDKVPAQIDVQDRIFYNTTGELKVDEGVVRPFAIFNCSQSRHRTTEGDDDLAYVETQFLLDVQVDAADFIQNSESQMLEDFKDWVATIWDYLVNYNQPGNGPYIRFTNSTSQTADRVPWRERNDEHDFMCEAVLLESKIQ